MTAATPPQARTLQILIDANVNVLITNTRGERYGFDLKNKNFVEEISGARSITREGSLTFIIPHEISGGTYRMSITGKSADPVAANLSMTGPGFVSGVHDLKLSAGQPQNVTLAADGASVSLTANRTGVTPELFITTQSGRDKPSYRFEITADSLVPGKTISLNLDLPNGRLNFKTDDANKTSFSLLMRRTNPGGTRDTFRQHDVSFSRANSYALDFGKWDGKDEACFYETSIGVNDAPCIKLKNESSSAVRP